LLVDPQCEQQAAAALVALLNDPDRRRAMGAAGRQRVLRHFTHQRMAGQMFEQFTTRLSHTNGRWIWPWAARHMAERHLRAGLKLLTWPRRATRRKEVQSC
jgi:hypothetical protein